MKVKVIARNEAAHTRESNRDTLKRFKNPDPKLHQLEKAREVRIFASFHLGGPLSHQPQVNFSCTSCLTYSRLALAWAWIMYSWVPLAIPSSAIPFPCTPAATTLTTPVPHQAKRAVNAVKMDRMFAAPFLHALDGHLDGITAGSSSPVDPAVYVSGAADGEIRFWHVPSKRCIWAAAGHNGAVQGVAIVGSGDRAVTVGDDGRIALWRAATDEAVRAVAGTDRADMELGEAGPASVSGAAIASDGRGVLGGSSFGHASGAAGGTAPLEPIATWSTGAPIGAVAACRGHADVAHQWVTGCRADVALWDAERSEAVREWSWGSASIRAVSWNPAETNMVVATDAERRVHFLDIRSPAPLRKLALSMSCNDVDWNPRVPSHFALASEDHNAYTFDMRALQRAVTVHKGHTNAVMSVAFSPTGRELATGSYDRTVRLWSARAGSSRDVYFAKRMQRVWTVSWSADAQYIMTGSDDTNVRVWKANASAALHKMLPREQARMEYLDALKARYAHLPEVKRISKDIHVPAAIAKAGKRVRDERNKENRKIEAENRHSRIKRRPEAERVRAVEGAEE